MISVLCARQGGKQRLLGISKRGNKYLRSLLIHGARAVLPHLAERRDALGRWLRELLARRDLQDAVARHVLRYDAAGFLPFFIERAALSAAMRRL